MLWLLFGQRIGNEALDGYSDKIMENINLVPFYTLKDYISMLKSGETRRITYLAIINLVGNVIMFVPLGFLLPFIYKRAKSFAGCMVTSFIILLCVEVTQLITFLGSFDIDDLLLNMVGAFIGYIGYKMMKIDKPSV